MVKGSFRWSGTPGANQFRVSGRLNGRKLARGSYRLVAHARNASGQVAAPVRVTFAIK
jgi:hypothetical protein